jgi:hypothetical protein
MERLNLNGVQFVFAPGCKTFTNGEIMINGHKFSSLKDSDNLRQMHCTAKSSCSQALSLTPIQVTWMNLKTELD